ncbi:uncharacterized protein PAC_16352 [Phialocephala subalpina]|uniref:F-box domain-containing protein n=1 Tax=Phialocephala subalpina TaxID=576137 RepID=A0A1L7XN10_9HELO|nr:uncharacterized protein PAC_16352 [Phialocephala subalpina]
MLSITWVVATQGIKTSSQLFLPQHNINILYPPLFVPWIPPPGGPMSAGKRQYSDMEIDYEDLERQYEILRRSPRHAEVMKIPDIVDRSMPPVRTTIQDLPLEILHNVLGRLDSRSLFNFTETCKGFCDVGRQLHKWFDTTYVQPNLPSFVFFKRLSNDPAYRGQVEHITFDTRLLGPPCPDWNKDPNMRTEHFNRWRRSRDALGLSLPPKLEDLALDLLGLDKLEALYDGHCDYFRGQEFTRRNMANMFPSDILASFTSLRSLLYSADTKWPGEDDNPVATSLLGLSQFPDRDLLFYFLIDSCKHTPSPHLTELKFWQMSVATWNMMEQVLPGHLLISNAFSNMTNLRRVDLQFRQPESRAEPRELVGAFNATVSEKHFNVPSSLGLWSAVVTTS